jgi:hypothetical protein
MDPLVNELLQGIDGAKNGPISPLGFVLVLLASAGLNAIIAKVYALTHGGYSYSKHFLQSIVLVGLIVSLIMVIIGSDIARAFALVGAMSIVRFRTPVKDSRDLIFIFAAIAVGMACGVQFFAMAAIFTVIMMIFVLIFFYSGFGELSDNGYVLRVQIRGGQRDSLSKAISGLCKRAAIVSISRFSQSDDVEDIIYEVELKRGVKYDDLVDNLAKQVNLLSINVLVGESSINA